MPTGNPERVAINEAHFRAINERLKRDLERVAGAGVERFEFVCECGRRDCSQMVSLSFAEYDAVRAHPRRFAVIAGHEAPGVERVVERGERYWVVEKQGPSARIADRTDPRTGADAGAALWQSGEAPDPQA